jgi:hypothetical protein
MSYTDTIPPRDSPTLPERLAAMRDEIDSILDGVCAECDGKSAAEIRAIFKRRLVPIVSKHFPDGSVNFRITK